MYRIIISCLSICCLVISCQQNNLVELDGVEKIFLKNCLDFKQDQYQIDSKVELLEIFKEVQVTTYCEDFETPQIDFNAETLLGLKSPSPIRNNHLVKREVMLDTDENKYIYIVYQDENVSETETQINWVIVPFLPDGYSVEFRLR